MRHGNREAEPDLELRVTVLNVNYGHNEELMKRCAVLMDYARYVARVRGYAASMDLETAVRRAVDECIAEGIMADFLRNNRAEVELTSLFEYNKEEEEKKLRRAEYEFGVENGLQMGIEQTKMETARSLAEMGMPAEDIARAVKASIRCVQGWLAQEGKKEEPC